MTKKRALIIFVSSIVVVALGWFGYQWFFTAAAVPPPPPRDISNLIVPPVEFPLTGFQLKVPLTDQLVVLDLVSPSSRRDYPMARFIHSSTSLETSLVAYDDFVTDVIDGWRAVLIAENQGMEKSTFYLARLRQAGDSWEHVDSVWISEFIRPQRIALEGDTVVLEYLVHEREQVLTEVPRVPTTAKVSLLSGNVLQAGRYPKTETLLTYKSFTGEYLWQQTVAPDGVVVTPATAGVFTMRFDANRIELRTDCNTGNTTFTTAPLPATDFTVDTLATTKMFCESAQEGLYFEMISSIESYEEVDEDTLRFILADGQVMTFAKRVRELQFES